MSLSHFRELYLYNHWANRRMLAAVSRLSPADFLKPMVSSFPSVRDTLAHILGAEIVWLARWRGSAPRGLPLAAEIPDMVTLEARWTAHQDELTRYLDELEEEALAKPLHYTNFKGEQHAYSLAQLLTHVANHSSYHRGQVVTLLRQLGAAAVATDYVAFLAERARG